ncbi:hypothetical protein LIA77_09038 [Sarocladium implicatum]|nr:hypothetical protein LIA77_09038 [Sarocladium implicatum]
MVWHLTSPCLVSFRPRDRLPGKPRRHSPTTGAQYDVASEALKAVFGVVSEDRCVSAVSQLARYPICIPSRATPESSSGTGRSSQAISSDGPPHELAELHLVLGGGQRRHPLLDTGPQAVVAEEENVALERPMAFSSRASRPLNPVAGTLVDHPLSPSPAAGRGLSLFGDHDIRTMDSYCLERGLNGGITGQECGKREMEVCHKSVVIGGWVCRVSSPHHRLTDTHAWTPRRAKGSSSATGDDRRQDGERRSCVQIGWVHPSPRLAAVAVGCLVTVGGVSLSVRSPTTRVVVGHRPRGTAKVVGQRLVAAILSSTTQY